MRLPLSSGRVLLLVGVCAAALLVVPHGAAAATKAEQQALLEKTLANPADYEAVYAYVRVSKELSDYEAAIGALERLLFYNQNLPRVKFEIGTLYYRLQSYHLAQRYFREVLATPGLDANLRGRVEAYMPSVEKQLAPVRSWTYASAGIRYQSNASATPTDQQVMSNGTLLPLDLSQPHGSDWNAYQIVQFANDIAFGSQGQNKLETRVSGYLSEQFRLTDLNVAMISASIGPRISLAESGWDGLAIKPYLTGSATSVGGAAPSTNAGAGLALIMPLGQKVVLTPSVEWRKAWYDNASNPNATLGTSDVLNAALATAIKFSDAFQVNLKGGYRRGTSDNAFQSYSGYSAEINLALRFNPPSQKMTHKWTVGPFARISTVAFDAPNPVIDPSTSRSDTSWQVGVVLDAPITANFGFNAAVTYERTNSNIPNYSYDSWSAMFGPTARF